MEIKKSNNKIYDEIIKSNGRAFLALPTGFGKTKITLDYLSYVKKSLQKKYWNNLNIVVVTYTLQNQIAFKKEIIKWKKKNLLKHIKFITYVSLPKIKGENISILVLDEAHHLTLRSFDIFLNNNIKRIIALSATPPVEFDKINLFDKLNLKFIYRSYDDALNLKRISNFNIYIHGVNMNGSEIVEYKKINQEIERLKKKDVSWDILRWYFLKRTKLLHDVKRRQIRTKELIKSTKGRKIVFTSSIKQAEELSSYTFHSKKGNKDLQDFIDGKIDLLVSVKALDEAVNLPNINTVIISTFYFKERRLIQRIGRGIRNDNNKPTNIHIIYVKNTIEFDKLKNNLVSINESKIHYVESPKK